VIRCSGARVDTTLGPVLDVDTNGRGVLGSYAVPHEVDTSRPVDRRPAVTEFVYLEGPAIKIAYALLTGKLHGQGTATLPANWHLGVADQYIALSDFENIGRDIWDTADPSAGVRVRFHGLEDEDGKAFIEEELYLYAGVFSPVRTTGELGLKRFSSVLSGAASVFMLTNASIVNVSPLEHDAKAVANQYLVRWNYDWVRDRFTRAAFLTDATSISKHGTAKVKRLEFRGMYGSVATSTDLANRFHALRDRYAGPPLRLTVTTFLANNMLEVGDVVTVRLPHVRDTSNDDYTVLDRAFEIQQVRIDWIKGTVTLSLFGSSEPASTSSEGLTLDAGTNLLDGFFDGSLLTGATDLSTVLSLDANGTMTADGTLTGVPTLFSPDPHSGVFYTPGDLIIPSGITLTITDNVQLHVGGTLEVQGKIDGRGRGIAGAIAPSSPTSFNDVVPGTPGYLGHSISLGGCSVGYASGYWRLIKQSVDTSLYFVHGENETVPFVSVRNIDGTNLLDLPADLRGTSGSSGGPMLYDSATWYPGGNGGNGGAGLRVIARGMVIQPSGEIDLSGGDGGIGGSVVVDGKTIYAGLGGFGAPGALHVLLDGSLATTPDLELPAGKVLVRSEFGSFPFIDTYRPVNQVFWTIRISTLPNSEFVNYDNYKDFTAPWQANKKYSAAAPRGSGSEQIAAQKVLDTVIYARPTAPNGYMYKLVGLQGGSATNYEIFGFQGTSWEWSTGSTEPTWPTTIGDTVVDGDMTWECVHDVYLSGASGGSRVQFVPRPEQPLADSPSYAQPASGLSPTISTNTPNTLNENLATVEVAVTPPSDATYSYSNIYYREQGTYGWQQAVPADSTIPTTRTSDSGSV